MNTSFRFFGFVFILFVLFFPTAVAVYVKDTNGMLQGPQLVM